ncbi:MAG: DUF4394 domain-containing protein [Bacteroidetes bacterium]|nr:DUF4394 domain-containing protein [Bacteroidota bacterium]
MKKSVHTIASRFLKTFTHRFVLAACFICLLSFNLSAQTIFGISGNNLVRFQVNTPQTIQATIPITGVMAGQEIVGLDSRPATGELFLLGYNNMTSEANLYTLDTMTAVATQVGSMPITLALDSGKVGFDFNPTVDRIRVVSESGANYRLNPITGGIAATDSTLRYNTGDLNENETPQVVSAAYINSYIGTGSTTLYDYDAGLNIITTQNPPNNGTLNTIGSSLLNVDSMTRRMDMDIFFDAFTSSNIAYAAVHVQGSSVDSLYTIDLISGAFTNVGPIGNGAPISNIAIYIDRTVPPLMGNLIYGLSGNNLIEFDSQNPGFLRSYKSITGITSGQAIAGMDVRPATGELFVLGYDTINNNAQLYTIDVMTAIATSIDSTPIQLMLGTGHIGFDFNPTVDRIRVIADNDTNYRLNPVTGAIAAIDQSLAYAASDINNGTDPNAGTAAYLNSYIGTGTTLLYTIDDSLGILATQNPPNSGTLNTIGTLGINLNPADLSIDMDIYFNPMTSANTAYVTANTGSDTRDALYFVDLSTGNATNIGTIGSGISVKDIAVAIDRTAPPITGRIIYGLSGSSLFSFDSDNTTFIRNFMPITGVTAGQIIVGMDVRPLNGDLFIMGYDTTASTAQLYTVDTTTAIATPVGASAITLNLGTGNVGFDFNPFVDRIRVVGVNDMNYRLNPITGTLAATDSMENYATGDMNFGADPSIGSVAYTNNYNGTGSTTLIGFDEGLNTFVTQTPPNDGTLNTIGMSGLTLNSNDLSVDMDIYFNADSVMDEVYFAANTDSSIMDNLYTIDLATGAATLIGRIGSGIMVKDIALYLPSTLTAINDLQINSMDLTAYPNPFRDVINVTYIATVSGNISLSVIDITGRLIESKSINSEIGVNNISLNTTGYNNGLYMIRLETASGKSSGIKMIK